MRRIRITAACVASLGLGLACLPQLAGCADESKTTGTQLQLTEQDKADIEGMRAAMKGQRVTEKQDRKQERKRKR